MSRFEDFRVGQKVAHVRLGDGRVSEVTPEYVSVRYDDKTLGEYDHRWFELHPTFLFHRSATVARDMARNEK